MAKDDTRVRLWATVVYPESAPDDWQSIISDLMIPCYISPLHDRDLNSDGTPKKAHHHVLFVFDCKKSRQQIEEITKQFGGVGQELVKSKRGYARYLCHMDNPEKAQYSPEDVIVIGAEDYFSLVSLPTDKYKNIREMIAWCIENNNFYYSDLCQYAMENRDDWFRTLCDNGTYVVKEYLKAENFKRKCLSEGQEDDC